MDELTDSIDIACPKCHKQFPHPIAGMPDHGTPVCPNCGYHAFTDGVTLKKFFQAVEKLEVEIERKDIVRRQRNLPNKA